MVFKSWSNIPNVYITFKEKFIGFIDQVIQATDYSEVESIIKGVSELSVMDVIQALFINANSASDIAISKNALDAYLTGSQPDQVFSYIVNSYWCLHRNLRSWGNSIEKGVV